MMICDHGKTLVNSIGEILQECAICYQKMVKDYERSTAPPKAEQKKSTPPKPVPNLFAS